MAASRLSDSQKSEIAERFRAGATSPELAEAYGCSPNTVIRAVKALLDAGEYERLKQQRGRGRSAAAPAATNPQTSDPKRVEPQASVPDAAASAAGSDTTSSGNGNGDASTAGDQGTFDDDDDGRVWALEDADDFSSDDDSELDDEDLDEDDDLDDEETGDDEDVDEEDEEESPRASGSRRGRAGRSSRRDEPDPFAPIAPLPIDQERPAASLQPLAAARLSASAYLLVDKTVELQARPLSDFPELGRLPEGESERQALAVFMNPRQAKRQCGRNQRVIKLPDPALLERTAPYLLAQGITRIVIEGALYSLPGA